MEKIYNNIHVQSTQGEQPHYKDLLPPCGLYTCTQHTHSRELPAEPQGRAEPQGLRHSPKGCALRRPRKLRDARRAPKAPKGCVTLHKSKVSPKGCVASPRAAHGAVFTVQLNTIRKCSSVCGAVHSKSLR